MVHIGLIIWRQLLFCKINVLLSVFIVSKIENIPPIRKFSKIKKTKRPLLLARSVYASVNRLSIGSDNGLSPIRHRTIIWTIARLLWIGPLETNFGAILIKIQNFPSPKMHLKYHLRNGDLLSRGRWVKQKLGIKLAVLLWFPICHYAIFVRTMLTLCYYTQPIGV